MNVAQLRALIAVADSGSITRAAERIGLSQSGASQAVSSLEEALGARLLMRGRRGVSLTATGESVVLRARDVLAGLDAIREIANAGRGLEKGRLRLASFPSVFGTLLPPLLRRFHTRYPGIEVAALEASDEEVATWLATGTVDIGIVMNPAPGDGATMLGRDEWVAVVPAGHSLARRPNGSVSLEELTAQPFVLATGGCSTHARSLARDAGLDLPDIRAEIRDLASSFTLVREGIGVALVPELSLPEDRRGLKVLRLAQPICRDLALKASPRSAESLVVQAFLTLAARGPVGEGRAMEKVNPSAAARDGQRGRP